MKYTVSIWDLGAMPPRLVSTTNIDAPDRQTAEAVLAAVRDGLPPNHGAALRKAFAGWKDAK